MMRILHVVPELDINAGMMSVVMNYYHNIDRTLIQFDFVYFKESETSHKDEIEALGGRTFFMRQPPFKPNDQIMLRNFFGDHQGEFTAIHCHPIWSATVFSKEAKRSGIEHVIQHIHSTRYSEKRTSAIRNRFLIKFISRFATDYIACNDEAALLFGKKIASSGQVMVFPNAIEVENYLYTQRGREAIRKELNISEETLVIGSVGRLSVEKNQSFLIKVFQKILDKHPDARLVLVGGGPLASELQNQVLGCGLQDKANLIGRRRDVQNLLSSFDIFILPSIFEGTPVSAIEARSAGLPCLLSDTITKSVAMDGVRYLSINEPLDRWADEVLCFSDEWKTHDRHDFSEVVNKGFDIKTEAKRLQDYYLKLR